MADDTLRVGFVGIGDQGGPIAHMIHRAGFPTTVWARRPEATKPFAAEGIATVASLRELGANCDFIGVCVTDDTACEQVILEQGMLDDIADGTIIAIHSTIHPDSSRRIAEQAEPRGARVLDAPVSGTSSGAWAATLVIMVGGDVEVLDRCRGVMAAYGTPRHLGEVGSGQYAKLVNNLCAMSNLALARDAIELGVQFGTDRDAIVDILRNGTARSFSMEFLATRGAELDRYAEQQPGDRVNIMNKDLELVDALIESTGADPGGFGVLLEYMKGSQGISTRRNTSG